MEMVKYKSHIYEKNCLNIQEFCILVPGHFRSFVHVWGNPIQEKRKLGKDKWEEGETMQLLVATSMPKGRGCTSHALRMYKNNINDK